MTEKIDHPNHYNQGKIECIEALESVGINDLALPFCIGNVIKYVWRYKNKNGLEDLKKAQWYLSKAISYLEDNPSP